MDNYIRIPREEYWDLRCESEMLFILLANGTTLPTDDKEDYVQACSDLEKEIFEILDMPVTTGRRSMSQVKSKIQNYLTQDYSNDINSVIAEHVMNSVKLGKAQKGKK